MSMKSKLAGLALLLFTTAIAGAQYQAALPGYQYQFPRDNFNHPGYQTEWWYYTGNLHTADGHRFGFELTFFRQGVSREPGDGDWYVHDLYMAHLALSDISGHRYYHVERLNRAGPGVAGIDESTGLIWNGNWQAHLDGEHQQLRGIADDFSIDLNLTSTKPPVIQGRNGISQKAAGAGHASHYISLTRLITSGTIQLNGANVRVDGSSWMDHEFFTGSMAESESGWDWVGLQFENRTELMLYRLRHKDGSVDPYSSGTFVDAQGKSTLLSARDFTMSPAGAVWTSAQTGGHYPLRWHISIPSLSVEIDLSTALSDQEMTSAFGPSYWEGAVDVNGREAGSPLHGDGYLEMTGYGSGNSNRNLP
jgi:predicted secreted hydrolase